MEAFGWVLHVKYVQFLSKEIVDLPGPALAGCYISICCRARVVILPWTGAGNQLVMVVI
jgi:hypothetical protein